MDDAWHYWSSYGMGLLEVLDWCENLHIDPATPAVATEQSAARTVIAHGFIGFLFVLSNPALRNQEIAGQSAPLNIYCPL
jgi:hypothetical protein